jgi:hypothetical protein
MTPTMACTSSTMISCQRLADLLNKRACLSVTGLTNRSVMLKGSVPPPASATLLAVWITGRELLIGASVAGELGTSGAWVSAQAVSARTLTTNLT